jgi:hypothetical protein
MTQVMEEAGRSKVVIDEAVCARRSDFHVLWKFVTFRTFGIAQPWGKVKYVRSFQCIIKKTPVSYALKCITLFVIPPNAVSTWCKCDTDKMPSVKAKTNSLWVYSLKSF